VGADAAPGLNERFVDRVAADEREALAREILALRRRARRTRKTNVRILREMRGPLT
jgi:hypothetical protein